MKFVTRILTANSSFPTARLIRDAIKEITGKHFYLTSNPKPGTHVLARYGNSDKIIGTDTKFNSKEFIDLVSNKLTFSNFCAANDIYSPKYFKYPLIPEKFPVVIRSTLTGWGGKGIYFAEDKDKFISTIKSGWFWTDFVRCSYEIRLHLFDTAPNRIYKKVKDDGAIAFPIRNQENGYHFSLQEESESKYKKAKELAEQLGNLFLQIGGHFSGIDMGYDPENRKYFVFEVNSAPGLNNINAGEYAKFFTKSLNLIEKQAQEEDFVEEE